MESLRQIGAGFLLAIISLSLVLGGFVLSVAEAGTISPAPIAVASPTGIAPNGGTVSVPTLMVPATSVAIATELVTATATPAGSSTPPPTPASCTPPAGWVAITVQTADTLSSLAQIYQTTVDAIMQANCLFSDQLVPGSFLYVPPQPTATLAPCGAPAGWVDYRVVAGDTLYYIAARYGGQTSVVELQKANCLGSSTYIHIGQLLKVPYAMPPTQIIYPSNTPVPAPTDTSVPAATDTPVTPATNTPVTPVPTDTPVTPAPTDTPVPPTPTDVPVPSPTPPTPAG